MKINIFNEVKKFRLPEKKRHVEWIGRVANILKVDKKGEINIIFIGRNTILKINKEYLGHNYITDVISFQFGKPSAVFGEIYVCPYQVRKNARYYKVTFENELRRVIAHGVLHLVGYNDNTEDERIQMRMMEEKMLLIWGNERK